jgi:tetratricopeptide (TPR) repeat protein
LASPLPLRQGIGNSHEEVSTRSRDAQAFYDQGLNYLEGYVWIEAARSFHQALRLDPDLAMAHVGLSRTYSGLGDRAAAERSLQQAKSLLSRVSPREQRRILLREKQLVAMRNIKDVKKFDAYKKAIDDALRANCEPQLWLLRGNAEEPDASGRGQYGTAASIIYYHHVLTMYPEYASAHHFLAHTYEALGQADSALAHGEAYARLAPAIPHAAHMLVDALRPKVEPDLKTYGSVSPARAETTR